MFEMLDRVRDIKTGMLGTVLLITTGKDGRTIYTVEDDDWDLYEEPTDSLKEYYEDEIEFIAHTY